MSTPARRTILVTGATGYIASQMLPTFRERYDLRLVDVRTTDRDGNEVPGARIEDVLDGPDEQIRPVFTGCDAVVHLAYHRGALTTGPSGRGRGYDDERPNVDMAERIFRLSLEEGVRRVVMASSNHAADWYEDLLHVGKMDVVDPERTPNKSDNYYGWAKFSTCRRLSLGATRNAVPRSIQPIGVQSSRASYFPKPTRTGSARSSSTPSA
jgi:nucleoside-diphosphate-sugar epimerase